MHHFKHTPINNALQLALLFDNFLDRHVGNTDDDNDGLYVIDQDGVLNNNLHKEDRGSSNGAPDGTATTEGQALMILGYLYMYAATENQYWLDKSTYYTESYIRNYYLRKPIPDKPQVFRSHIYINGRAPFITAGPNTWRKGSRTGTLEYDMDFKNGRGLVKSGYPDHGDEIIYIPFAFDGYLKWRSIVADVLQHGSTSKEGKKFDVAWYIDYRGYKVDPEGEILSQVNTEPKGTVQLKDTKVNGKYRINYASNNGSTIDRHEPFENWPIWIPVRNGEEGNAADAEEWFTDCAGLMYYFTKDERYKRLYECCIETLIEISGVDQNMRFFRKDKEAGTPFTDGISYEYSYSPGNVSIVYDRDSNGNIKITKAAEPNPKEFTDISLEQIASWFHVDNNSKVIVDYGHTDADAITSIRVTIMDKPQTAKGIMYEYAFKQDTSTVKRHTIPMQNFVEKENFITGRKYYKLDGTSFVPYGDARFEKRTGENIRVDADYRVDRFGRVVFGNTSYSGIVCGFWSIASSTNGELPMGSITYRNVARSDPSLGSNCDIAIVDAAGVKWSMQLPYQPQFQTFYLDWKGPWKRTDGKPGVIKPGNLKQIEIQKHGSEDTSATIDLYAFNGVPSKFNGKGVLKEYNMTITGIAANTIYTGDSYVESGADAAKLNAPYTPGVIPFSTNFSVETQQVDSWRGIPYLGYQYPIIWGRDKKYEERMNNMTKFMRDSQTDYHRRRGLKGPVSAAYVWPRWDNGSYGEFNTFVDVFWGSKQPWAGYYSRCMYGMCRLRYHLVRTGRKPNDDVVQFTEDWIDYLADFMKKNDNWTPTVFHSNREPYTYDGDFTGHMSASFLAGACECYLAGSRNPNLETVIEGIYTQFERQLINLGTNHHMNGGYSVWAGGNYFFGVWTEILRGFGAYIMYHKKKLYGDSYTPPYE